MKKVRRTFFLNGALLIAATALISACTTDNPPVTGLTTPPPPAAAPQLGARSIEQTFTFSNSEATIEQNKYDENTVSVHYQVSKDGKSVNDLSEKDFTVTENGLSVQPFSLAADVARSNEVAEIMFLVDITGTMVELIETAKLRLKEFIKSSRERGYHTRMCFATFGDYTVKKCARFFDNNPNDPSSEAQVRELLSELSKLHAYRGEGRDPGYPDLDENPMQALVDASKAPWGSDSQRFVILVTDWGFLYSPGNQGEQFKRGQIPAPPTMKIVTDALKTSQMRVFAVTRTQHTHKGQKLVWDGYNTPFQGEESIVKTSNGEYFDFDKVMRKEITLDQILEQILKRVDTNYKITYVVDKVQGLDATLPVDRRHVDIKLNNPDAGAVKVTSVSSSMPTGRANYQQNWKVSENSIKPGSMKVYQGDKEVPPGEYTVQHGEVRFKAVPAAGTKFRLVFLYEKSDLNLRMEPISLRGQLSHSNTKVLINGIPVREEDVNFTPDLNGNTSVDLNTANITAAHDPYDIARKQGLTLRVEAKN